MKKTIILYIILTACFSQAYCQDDDIQYRRISIYSLLINHTEADQSTHAAEIRSEFLNIPVPEKYNDHNLAVNIIMQNEKVREKVNTENITDWIIKNNIGSRLVAKWFMRDRETGTCSMDLIKARGMYNATEFDKELAAQSTRGIAMLQDAGEDLIGNTYLLVNEVRYINKANRSAAVGSGLYAVGMLAGAFMAGYSGDNSWVDLGNDAGKLANSIASSYKGFRVKILTRLYKLDWDEEISGYFYSQCYTESPDPSKLAAFENARSKFTMTYIGSVESKGNQTSFLGINEEHPTLMIRKACQRAIDENIVDLAHKYPQFRVRCPITVVDPSVQAPIGMKEGVKAGKRYEVLETVDHNGRIEYRRVGIVSPVASQIWDNRFMAEEEGAPTAKLGATTFTTVSGHGFYPGMLLREI